LSVVARLMSGFAVLGGGGTHLWLWFHGYRSVGVGPSFMADAVVAAMVGAWILWRASRPSAVGGCLVSAGALVSYAMVRTVGLLGFEERTWTGGAIVAVATEALTLVVLVTELLLPTAPGQPQS